MGWNKDDPILIKNVYKLGGYKTKNCWKYFQQNSGIRQLRIIFDMKKNIELLLKSAGARSGSKKLRTVCNLMVVTH